MLFTIKKNKCDQCDERFDSYDELISHARHIHHHPIVKCILCGKEFIHEKDRLHHSRKEHEEKIRERTHKKKHPEEQGTTQDRVDRHTSHFHDKL